MAIQGLWSEIKSLLSETTIANIFSGDVQCRNRSQRRRKMSADSEIENQIEREETVVRGQKKTERVEINPLCRIACEQNSDLER